MARIAYGFWVQGDLSGPRRLVDYWKALRGYCRVDPGVRPEVPAYLSAFAFGADFRRHLEATDSTRDFSGSVGVPSVKWDIDRPGDAAAALLDTRRLAAYLLDHYALAPSDLLVGFSGDKGFHVELLVGWRVEPDASAHRVCRRFAEKIAAEIGVPIDSSVYDKVRAFRLWNSRHQRTGLYKIRLDAEDLLYMSADWIRGQAGEPIPFELPDPSRCPAAEADWRDAEQAVLATVQERRARPSGAADARINRATLELVTDPVAVTQGTRSTRLFQAAANLAEFGSIDELIHALLTEPALDTGLPPREVKRQIQCGIEFARQHRGGKEVYE